MQSVQSTLAGRTHNQKHQLPQCTVHTGRSTYFACAAGLFSASDYEDEYDAFLVSSEPHRQKMWSEFFELDRFKRARVGLSLTKAVTRWEGAKFESHPAYIGTSSLGVLEQMARLGVHRVPVLTETDQVHGLVTQSMFISLFSQEMHRTRSPSVHPRERAGSLPRHLCVAGGWREPGHQRVQTHG